MEITADRLAYPLTFLLKREGNLWASLCVEMTVSSCGNTREEAREALMSAVRSYYLHLTGRGCAGQAWRPMGDEELEAFKHEVPGEIYVERYVMIVRANRLLEVRETSLHPEDEVDFVPLVTSTADPRAFTAA